MNAKSANRPNVQVQAIFDAVCALRVHENQVIELRGLHVPTSRTGIASGYYDDHQKLAADAAKLDREKAGGVYVTLNEIDPALLARAANRLKYHIKTGETTTDGNVIRRLWLPIDVDPVRPAGISSTDEQVQIAEVVRDQCETKMKEWLGMEPTIVGFSGNGHHLLYRLDEPISKELDEAVKNVLQRLDAEKFDPRVAIDTGNFNPARIWKLYGTTARKGDDMPDRPHRLSRIVRLNGMESNPC